MRCSLTRYRSRARAQVRLWTHLASVQHLRHGPPRKGSRAARARLGEGARRKGLVVYADGQMDRWTRDAEVS